MGQKFILPKSVLNYNGQQVRVDFWEWMAMALPEDQLVIFDQESIAYDAYILDLIDTGRYIEDVPPVVMPNGDSCSAFILPGAPGDIPGAGPHREEWEAKFAADPNVEYVGPIYVYHSDV